MHEAYAQETLNVLLDFDKYPEAYIHQQVSQVNIVNIRL